MFTKAACGYGDEHVTSLRTACRRECVLTSSDLTPGLTRPVILILSCRVPLDLLIVFHLLLHSYHGSLHGSRRRSNSVLTLEFFVLPSSLSRWMVPRHVFHCRSMIFVLGVGESKRVVLPLLVRHRSLVAPTESSIFPTILPPAMTAIQRQISSMSEVSGSFEADYRGCGL